MSVTKLIPVMFQKVPIIQRRTVWSLRENMFQIKASYSLSTSEKYETELKDLLKKKFPLAKRITVRDISGGCGAMFEVSVTSTEFDGLTLMQQHRLVNAALSNKIKGMHGITIYTEIP